MRAHPKPEHHHHHHGGKFFKYVLPCSLIALLTAHIYFVSKYAEAKQEKKATVVVQADQESMPPVSVPVHKPAPFKTVPFKFPMFKQSDSRWGQDIMVTKTISQVGCLMSSTSMALAGCNIPINN